MSELRSYRTRSKAKAQQSNSGQDNQAETKISLGNRDQQHIQTKQKQVSESIPEVQNQEDNQDSISSDESQDSQDPPASTPIQNVFSRPSLKTYQNDAFNLEGSSNINKQQQEVEENINFLDQVQDSSEKLKSLSKLNRNGKASKNSRIKQVEQESQRFQAETQSILTKLCSTIEKLNNKIDSVQTERNSEIEGETPSTASKTTRKSGKKKSDQQQKSLQEAVAENSQATQQTASHLLRPINLNKYNGEDNPKSFIEQFEKYCSRLGLPETEYLSELKDFLAGRARSWYERNSSTFMYDYYVCKGKFLEAFFKDPKIARIQLNACKQNMDEDLHRYFKRLEDIAKPPGLIEEEIRQALLMGIRDPELNNYAQQQFLYLNQNEPLERVLLTLQGQEAYFAKRSRIQQRQQLRQPQGNFRNNNGGNNTINPVNRTPINKVQNPATRRYDNRNRMNSRGPVQKSQVHLVQSEQNQQNAPQAQEVVATAQTQQQQQETQQESSHLNSIINPEQIQLYEEYDDPEYEDDYAYGYHTDYAVVLVEGDVQHVQQNYTFADSYMNLAKVGTVTVQNEQSIHQTDQKYTNYNNILFDLGQNTEYNNPLFILQQEAQNSVPEDISNLQDAQATQAFEESNWKPVTTPEGKIQLNSLQDACYVPLSITEQLHTDTVLQYQNNRSTGAESIYSVTEQTPKQSDQQGDPISYTLCPDQVLRYIKIKVNNYVVNSLIDTGCTTVVATQSFIDKWNLSKFLEKRFRAVTTAEANTIKQRDILPNAKITFLQEPLKNIELKYDMMVMQHNPCFEVILGRAFLKFFNYAITEEGVTLRHPTLSSPVSIPYEREVVFSIAEQDVDGLNVLLKGTDQFGEETNTLYPQFPPTQRDIIYLDPPWKYFKNNKNIRQPQYPQLSYQELLQLPIRQISKEDGILLMWATSPMLRQALSLILSYGYVFKTVLFVWLKLDENSQPQIGKGYYTSPCCEYLLLATRGQFLKFLQDKIEVSQLIQAHNFKSSRKPTEIYSKLNQVFKLSEFDNLEIFSVQPPGSELFSHYGNSVQGRYQQSLSIPKERIAYLEENYKVVDEQGNLIHDPQADQILMTQEELMKAYAPEELLTETQVLNQIKICDPQYLDIIKSNIDVFAKGDLDLGKTDIVQHKIELKPGSEPRKQKPYKYGQLETKAINSSVSQQEKMGVIREEPSPYQHPIVIVPKPGHTKEVPKYRTCINFKHLNSQTIDDKYPIPLIAFLFMLLVMGMVFTKLDGKSGFWQVLMAIESIWLTGFVTQDKQYVYLRMPFGLKNAPATFQRLMNELLKGFIHVFVIVYIDDIIVFSRNHQEHKQHLQQVFDRLRNANLKLGGDKCEIGALELNILGHTIRDKEVLPQKSKVEAILKILPPQNITELRSFLGLCGYYRQFIPKFAHIAHPLFPLMGKDIPYKWTPDHQKSFEKLKESLAVNPVLGMLQNDRPLVLYTDFSIVGLGAVLAQKVSDRKEKVIEFASRTLQPYERSLDSYSGEVLAVYWATQKFRQYILSVPFSLEIVTDNKALEWVLKLGTSSPLRKIQRWTLEIDQYAYHVRHRKGSTHINADALSRLIGQIPSELSSQVSVVSADKIYYMEDVGDLACSICKQTHEDSPMMICDKCGDAFHIQCVNLDQVPQGTYYCEKCLDYIQVNKPKDVIYNQNLIDYLESYGPQLTEKAESVEYQNHFNQSDRLRFKDFVLLNHRLYHIGEQGQYQLVPTEIERKTILVEQHHLCGHGGIERTSKRILEQYWWEKVLKDVKTTLMNCEICNVCEPTFSQRPELTPIPKGTFPFQILAADLITNLQDSETLLRENEDPLNDQEMIQQRLKEVQRKASKQRKNKKGPGRPKKGSEDVPSSKVQFNDKLPLYKHCIVVIDVFSKYIELGALTSKSSEEIQRWFDQRIICRYGSPIVLRTDQGTEFLGALDILAKDHNIQMRKISSHYPQANGQAEAMVKTVTRILRKFLLSKHYQNLHWWEILPYVQRSINTSQSTSTQYTPHEIVYGSKMHLTDSVNYTTQKFTECFPDLTPQEVTSYVTKLQESLENLQTRVKIHLGKQDERMIRQYQSRVRKEIIFEKDQRVYQQNLRTNKLQPRVLGPFIFQKYGPTRATADVINPDNGNTKRVATNTLCPASSIQCLYV